MARHQGGWGRIKYINDQLGKYCPEHQLPDNFGIPEWDSTKDKVRDYFNYLTELEERGIYFSYPLDLDFAMFYSFPKNYGANDETCTDSILSAVLGTHHGDATQYTEKKCKLFSSYNRFFKRGSKPAAHIEALSKLDDEVLGCRIPKSLGRLADAIIAKLKELPE